MTTPLASPHRRQLAEWLGGNNMFELLYSASRDGCGADTFHSKCDDKGATVVLVHNAGGYVFGGFTSMNWNTKCGQTFDDKAFLFRLDKDGTFNPRKYKIKTDQASNSINNTSSYGPCFGKSEIIVCGSGAYSKSEGQFSCGNEVKFDGTYDMRGDGEEDFVGSKKEISEIEVFKVKDEGIHYDSPWRKLGQTKLEQLMSEIEEYCPLEDTKLTHVNILLVGAVGSGKSSYVNTINSLFKGYVTGQARTGSAATSLTTVFTTYKVRSKSGVPMKFRLCDSRGLEEEKGIRDDDLVAVLDGHVGNGFQFNLSSKPHNTPGYKKSPTFSDTMHCVAFVVDASTADIYSSKILQTIKEFQETVNCRGIPQVILLTKVDKVCPVLDNDLSNLYSSVPVAELVDTAAQTIGLPRSCVLPVKNYEKETELDPSVDIPAVISLRQMLRLAEDYLYVYLDRQES